MPVPPVPPEEAGACSAGVEQAQQSAGIGVNANSHASRVRRFQVEWKLIRSIVSSGTRERQGASLYLDYRV
jgi:hypothetical protein